MTARAPNRTREIESFQNAEATIGPITAGMSLFTITRGQFSMIDAIYHCLKEIGVAEVSIWTWTVAVRHAEIMAGFMAQKEITRATIICDQSLDRRDPVLVESWRQRFGDDTVKICKNHCKICRVWNDRFRLLLRGSMNLNVNPRFEQLDITEGGDDFDMVERMESELKVLPRKYGNVQSEANTQVSKAFDMQQLQMFRGIKTWKKSD